MKTIYLLLYLLAAICFAVAVVIPAPGATTTTAYGARLTRFNLVAAGLFAWVLVDLIQQFDRVTD